MSQNDADGMANNVDPDLGAVWSGSALFAQAYLSENFGLLQYYFTEERLKSSNYTPWDGPIQTGITLGHKVVLS